MKNSISFYIVVLVISLLGFAQCKNQVLSKTQKNHPNDPFQKSITPSQFFEIDASEDVVVEGKNGTIVVFPKGSLVNADGAIWNGKVNVELAEALTLDEMIRSNLTTTSNGKMLETDGMIYINVTAGSQQLAINKDIPIYIEIPTKQKKAGMKAYKGVRDENGNMNWTKPKELERYLVNVDINSLDFLPPGFEREVKKGMPYKNHKKATKQLTDSLYYSINPTNLEILQSSIFNTQYNEARFNAGNNVINGAYTKESFHSGQAVYFDFPFASDSLYDLKDCGIDPAKIKVISSDKYQKTFIATREFETRLQYIHKICQQIVLESSVLNINSNLVLETYILNIDKNLYEADSIVAHLLEGSIYQERFVKFYKQKLTKVKFGDIYAKLLKGHYERELEKIKAALEAESAAWAAQINKEREEFNKVADNYRTLLWKREKYRMETYGFTWTNTGWLNIDKGVNEVGTTAVEVHKEGINNYLDVNVSNGKKFDRVHTYILYDTIKSIYRLNNENNQTFYTGNKEYKTVDMFVNIRAQVIAIGYKDDKRAFTSKNFITCKDTKINLSLRECTIQEFNETLKALEGNGIENCILEEQKYLEFMHKEAMKQKSKLAEINWMLRLYAKVYHCCARE